MSYYPDVAHYTFEMDSVYYHVTDYDSNIETYYTPLDTTRRIFNNIGYFDSKTNVHYHYIKNHLGNICAVVNSTADTLVQSTIYYANGVPMGETKGIPYYLYMACGVQPNQNFGRDEQPYLYNGKEFIEAHGLNEYDSQARMYYAPIMRTTTMDPYTEDYYHLSPYSWCGNNPIAFVDPDGRSTKVVKNEDGTYTVIGGDVDDNDLHIYEYTKDKDGNDIKGNAIGVTTSTTSFYNSDTKEWGGQIDPIDESGQAFLAEIFGNKISLADYKQNAHGKELYDFKYSNGTIDGSDDNQNMYRGMPLCRNQNGEIVYSSARDIGNIAAGYIAGSNGISWGLTRIAFDYLQSKQDKRLSIEGISSRNAQYLGWCMGYYNNSPRQQSCNTLKSFKLR